jgi:hypothetical protein
MIFFSVIDEIDDQIVVRNLIVIYTTLSHVTTTTFWPAKFIMTQYDMYVCENCDNKCVPVTL